MVAVKKPRFLLLALLGVVLFLPGCSRQQTGREAQAAASPVTACVANMKRIAAALEAYSADNGGAYPPDLQHLIPKYLQAMPSCPAAGRDTYSAAYKTQGKTCFFCCGGQNHSAENVGPDLPKYSSEQAMVMTQ